MRAKAKRAQAKQSRMDPLACLGGDVMLKVFSSLSVNELAKCACVSKAWASLAASGHVWWPHCRALLEAKSHLDLVDLVDSQEDLRAWCRRQKAASTCDFITTDELCKYTWTFRFKRGAGAYWLSWDPYWTKRGYPMTRHFMPDGSVLGVPSHEPYWMPEAECRWRFTKSGNLLCGKRVRRQFVKVNHWPSLSISRTEEWGWRMENCWVVYTSTERRQDEALKEALLKRGASAASG